MLANYFLTYRGCPEPKDVPRVGEAPQPWWTSGRGAHETWVDEEGARDPTEWGNNKTRIYKIWKYMRTETQDKHHTWR